MEIFQGNKFQYVGVFNPLNDSPTKWWNTLKQLVGNNFSVFNNFLGWELKGLKGEKSRLFFWLGLNTRGLETLSCYVIVK